MITMSEASHSDGILSWTQIVFISSWKRWWSGQSPSLICSDGIPSGPGLYSFTKFWLVVEIFGLRSMLNIIKDIGFHRISLIQYGVEMLSPFSVDVWQVFQELSFSWPNRVLCCAWFFHKYFLWIYRTHVGRWYQPGLATPLLCQSTLRCLFCASLVRFCHSAFKVTDLGWASQLFFFFHY